MPKIPFPAALDNSMMRKYRDCRQNFFLEYMLHLRKKDLNIDLLAGGAFARGLEVTRKSFYEEHLTEEQAVHAGLLALIQQYGTPETFPDEAKTIDRIMGALVYYFDTYRLATDNIQPLYLGEKPAIEVTFSEPMPVAHPETGDPLISCGRFDMIGRYKSLSFIIDEKTTRQLGKTYEAQFEFSAQLQGYIHGAISLGYKIEGFIVRAIAIRKGGYDTREIMRYTSSHLQERWHETTVRTMRRMVQDWKNNEWDYEMGFICGRCSYRLICTATQPEKVESDYAIVKWNPLERKEELVRKDKHYPVFQG